MFKFKKFFWVFLFCILAGCKAGLVEPDPIIVPPPVYLKPEINFSADKINLVYGESITAKWKVKYADACSLAGQKIDSVGSLELKTLIKDTTLTIIATGKGGSASSSLTLKVGDWTTSDLGLITYSYWMLKTLKYIQDGVVIQNVILTDTQKTGHLQFGLDNKLYDNGVFSFNWSFGTTGHLLMNGFENDYSVTKTELVISYASQYNSKPAIIELTYGR